jgi:hypothetical protein
MELVALVTRVVGGYLSSHASVSWHCLSERATNRTPERASIQLFRGHSKTGTPVGLPEADPLKQRHHLRDPLLDT